MSNNWIKVRIKLRTDPRTLALAAKLQCHPTLVLGGLFQLWSLGDEHGEYLRGFSRSLLSQIIGVPGFAEALPKDWLQDRSGGLLLPDYEKHNGSTGKKRAQNAKRQKDLRDRNADRNAPDVTSVTPSLLSSSDTSELPNANELPRARNFEGAQFERDFWDAYPKIPNKANANRENARREWFKLTDAERSQAAVAVKVFAGVVMAMKPEAREKKLGPATFLANRNFSTDPATWDPHYRPPKLENRPTLVNHEWVDRWYVWIGDREHGPFKTRAEAEAA